MIPGFLALASPLLDCLTPYCLNINRLTVKPFVSQFVIRKHPEWKVDVLSTLRKPHAFTDAKILDCLTKYPGSDVKCVQIINFQLCCPICHSCFPSLERSISARWSKRPRHIFGLGVDWPVILGRLYYICYIVPVNFAWKLDYWNDVRPYAFLFLLNKLLHRIQPRDYGL